MASELRLFVALELPADWTEALAGVRAGLRRRGLERLRWVRPEGIHLTLKFLGNVAAGRVPELAAALGRAGGDCAPFQLSLGGLGTFGPAARPRVVWAGIEGDLGALTRLWRLVEGALQPLGFPRERERFAPHLTLARVPQGFPREDAARIGPALATVARPGTAPVEVRELALMRSDLGPGGARYTRLAAVELKGNCPE